MALWHFCAALLRSLSCSSAEGRRDNVLQWSCRVVDVKCVFLRRASRLGRGVADSWVEHFPMSSGVVGSARRPCGSCFVHTRMACLWLPNYAEGVRNTEQLRENERERWRLHMQVCFYQKRFFFYYMKVTLKQSWKHFTIRSFFAILLILWAGFYWFALIKSIKNQKICTNTHTHNYI